ncbi:MAG: DUF2892 domain-containing protein [Parachlamydiaceae bacterium]|nr:DUF2892 domain-containing protein [Parachlamydiaceae bacterium]
MKQNIGTTDRMIRLSLGIIFLILAWWQSSWIALAIALFTFYEALAGWCVMYQLLGKSSCPINPEKK